MSKVVYEVVTVASRGGQKQSVTVTFNYDLRAGDLILLVGKLMEVKMFKRFRIGHFEVREGHISDYNRNSEGAGVLIDDLDQF